MSKPTAAEVRAYFQADPKRVARLTEAEAHTVRPGARGRIHPGALAKARGKVKGYAVGNSKEVSAQAKADALAVREAARAQGITVGQRGPLPKAVSASPKG